LFIPQLLFHGIFRTGTFSAAAFTDIKNLYEKDLEMLYRVGRFGAKPREI